MIHFLFTAALTLWILSVDWICFSVKFYADLSPTCGTQRSYEDSDQTWLQAVDFPINLGSQVRLQCLMSQDLHKTSPSHL